MTLNEWAKRHNMSQQAMTELRHIIGATDVPSELHDVVLGTNEAAVQSRVRLAASQMGWRVWRNNIGAGTLTDGSFVRWGLANDSAALNQQLKSSDLIGIRPRLIGPTDIGTTIGQFVSLEVKHAHWQYTGTGRERAQSAWLTLVQKLGAHARFVTSEGGIE